MGEVTLGWAPPQMARDWIAITVLEPWRRVTYLLSQANIAELQEIAGLEAAQADEPLTRAMFWVAEAEEVAAAWARGDGAPCRR